MYESFTEYLTSIYGFGGRYRFEGTFVELCRECLQDIYTLGILPLIYLHNSSTIWVELEKKTKEVHHDWILTIQVSFGVKIYRFEPFQYISILLCDRVICMPEGLQSESLFTSRKVLCKFKYKTQVLFSWGHISFQFLYVIGRHISLIG